MLVLATSKQTKFPQPDMFSKFASLYLYLTIYNATCKRKLVEQNTHYCSINYFRKP